MISDLQRRPAGVPGWSGREEGRTSGRGLGITVAGGVWRYGSAAVHRLRPSWRPGGPSVRPGRLHVASVDFPSCLHTSSSKLTSPTPERYEKYKAASPGAIAAGGGRFLVRGGELAVLEGDWQPSRLVVLESKDLAAAKLWYRSEVYREGKKLREGAAHLRVVAVPGLDQRTGGSSLSLKSSVRAH